MEGISNRDAAKAETQPEAVPVEAVLAAASADTQAAQQVKPLRNGTIPR